jgi:uncharacterized protein YxeA
MNKTIKIILVLVIVIIAVVLILHHTNFDAVMRKLHGG